MEDTIEADRKQRMADRKPAIDILPREGTFNPEVKIIDSNTLVFNVYYTNYGSSFAKMLHGQYFFVIQADDTFGVFPDRVIGGINKASIFPPINGLQVQDGMTLTRKFNNPNEIIFQCAIFCYRDSLERSYGPYVRVFKWKATELKDNAKLATDIEFEKVKASIRSIGRWPEKYF